MASLYRKKKSPFLWLQYKTPDGKWKQKSTKCRADILPDVRRAKQMEAEQTLVELKYGDGNKLNDAWNWVTEFLEVRYRSKPHTLERYLCSWETLRIFIKEMKIEIPAMFRRDHCYKFIDWRMNASKEDGKYSAKINTAILDLKVARMILQEAVERKMITGNPAVKLGIERDRATEKPELSDEDCALIRAKIPTVKNRAVREMLAHSFEIARHQGCRLMETRLNPMTDVTLPVGSVSGRISFRIKGGRYHVAPLHHALVPLFTQLKKERKTSTWNPPAGANRQWAATNWYKFLDRIGLKEKGVTFHGTRVTVATELARSNVPENKAMKYLGHASTTVHRIYQRLRPDDLNDCMDAIG